MLKQTEYFTRWRFDYRLYRPILRFARDQGLPLVALNVPRELTERVAADAYLGRAATFASLAPQAPSDPLPRPGKSGFDADWLGAVNDWIARNASQGFKRGSSRRPQVIGSRVPPLSARRYHG